MMKKTTDWNQRYANSNHLFGTEINQFMLSQTQHLQPGMNALSIADGEAFNSIWLAQRGLNVTSIDISYKASEKARQNIEAANVNVRLICNDILSVDLSDNGYDVITVFFLHIPHRQRQQLHKIILRHLNPDGILLYECFHKSQSVQKWGPDNEDLLIDEKTIAEDCSQLTSLFIDKNKSIAYEEKLGEKTVVTLQYAGLNKIENG